MTCHTAVLDGVALTVCRTEMVEFSRESVGEKWCFRCRKRLPHDFVVMVEEEPGYYGPTRKFECSKCKGDFTCFPGTWREWVE